MHLKMHPGLGKNEFDKLMGNIFKKKNMSIPEALPSIFFGQSKFGLAVF